MLKMVRRYNVRFLFVSKVLPKTLDGRDFSFVDGIQPHRLRHKSQEGVRERIQFVWAMRGFEQSPRNRIIP
jgi:hypothetical protein